MACRPVPLSEQVHTCAGEPAEVPRYRLRNGAREVPALLMDGVAVSCRWSLCGPRRWWP